MKLRNMTIHWEKVPNAFLSFFCLVVGVVFFKTLGSLCISEKVSESMKKYFQNRRQKKKPQRCSYVNICAYETFSSADNAVSDTLSNADNIECCIKIP